MNIQYSKSRIQNSKTGRDFYREEAMGARKALQATALPSWRPLRLRGSKFLLFSVCLLLAASDAQAMHISEGILPFNWAAIWFVLVAPFVGYGLYRLRKMSERTLPSSRWWGS